MGGGVKGESRFERICWQIRLCKYLLSLLKTLPKVCSTTTPPLFTPTSYFDTTTSTHYPHIPKWHERQIKSVATYIRLIIRGIGGIDLLCTGLYRFPLSPTSTLIKRLGHWNVIPLTGPKRSIRVTPVSVPRKVHSLSSSSLVSLRYTLQSRVGVTETSTSFSGLRSFHPSETFGPFRSFTQRNVGGSSCVGPWWN